MITILRSIFWSNHHGAGSGDSGTADGLEGQLSECCTSDGTVFWVRENLELDHFVMSSGARLGLKRGAAARWDQQILELCAPAHCWQQLADMVHGVDAYHRPIKANRTFTAEWACAQLTSTTRKRR